MKRAAAAAAVSEGGGSETRQTLASFAVALFLGTGSTAGAYHLYTKRNEAEEVMEERRVEVAKLVEKSDAACEKVLQGVASIASRHGLSAKKGDELALRLRGEFEEWGGPRGVVDDKGTKA